jgi:hypothetical protein
VEVGGWPTQKWENLLEKQTESKRAGGLTQVRECFASKCAAPNSIPSTPPKKKKGGGRGGAWGRGDNAIRHGTEKKRCEKVNLKLRNKKYI